MTSAPPASWGQLFGPGHRGPVGVLAGGTLAFAVDTYVTASLLPSAVAEIGGAAFYSWVTTLFLLAAVVASALVSRLLAVVAAGRAYLLALAVFGCGSLVDALAPSMAVLLAGRVVQGVGGGLLAGMGYALIRTTLPPRLWIRGSALIAAMWGIALVVGPGLGGLLAEIGRWRWAFGALVIACGVLAVVVPRALGGVRAQSSPGPFPVGSILLVGAAAGVVSVAGLAADVRVAGGGLVLAVLLVVGFLAHERRTAAAILPRATFRRGSPLRWVYGVSAVMVGVAGVDAFVPLIGQQAAGLTPVGAGFLGVALGAGWVLGEMVSASARRPRRRVIVGPVLFFAGVAVAAVAAGAATGLVATGLWGAGLALGGAGIGTAWPHLAAAAIGAGDDDATAPADAEQEGDRASAAVTTVQMLAVSLGTAVGGVALALGATDPAASAQWLFTTFAVMAGVGALAAVAAARAVPERA